MYKDGEEMRNKVNVPALIYYKYDISLEVYAK